MVCVRTSFQAPRTRPSGRCLNMRTLPKNIRAGELTITQHISDPASNDGVGQYAPLPYGSMVTGTDRHRTGVAESIAGKRQAVAAVQTDRLPL